jgi:hypothetical protein
VITQPKEVTDFENRAVAQDVLVAGTSCLDCPTLTLKQLVQGLKSLTVRENIGSNHSRIIGIFIVNEVSPNGIDWQAKVKKQLPNIMFHQKTNSSQRGQGASFNIIMNALKEYGARYWLNWEQSWIVKAPYVQRSIDVMEQYGVSEVEATEDQTWTTNARPAGESGVFIVEPIESMSRCEYGIYSCMWDASWYPLFSLHPGLKRVDSLLLGWKFDEDLAVAPGLIAEYGWACHMLRGGAKKAFLDPPAIVRQAGHISSWAGTIAEWISKGMNWTSYMEKVGLLRDGEQLAATGLGNCSAE